MGLITDFIQNTFFWFSMILGLSMVSLFYFLCCEKVMWILIR